MHFRQLLSTLIFCVAATSAFAQYPIVPIRDIQYVDAAKLAACNDSSSYFGDTVTVVGIVIMDGNLTEVASGSVQGGFRPGVHLLDTAGGGIMGDFRGIQIMGVYTDASNKLLPVNDIYNLYAGMTVKVTGIVSRFAGETQMTPLDNSSLTVLGTGTAPTPITVNLGNLNDNNRINQLPTGEAYEGSFIELKDVTVISVNPFSGNRVSFDVQDANGNKINVSDRFLVQKTPSYSTTRPSAPIKQGTFVAPVIGTRYESLKGMILHSANGCLGGTGRGYELNPFDTSHYKIGVTPPSITEINRTPSVPKATENALVSAKITDSDGSITAAELHYSTDETDPVSAFVKVNMTLKSGTTDEYEATIPMQPNGTLVRYYLRATDNMSNVTLVPSNALATKPNFMFYTVRANGMTIQDVQKVLDYSADNSPYLGKQVTVKGVVTASAKSYDLEYVYIQDPDFNEWSGIYCTGNSDLIKLYRTEEVIVTGTVQESFGFTTLNVTSVTKTGNRKNVAPVTITQNDSAKFASREIEKYESMLVQYVNAGGGKIKVINPRLSNFGEYIIGADDNNSWNQSARVQAGIQNNNNFSSLWVSVVSDTSLRTQNGEMQVPVVKAEKGQTLDTLVGILYYGFNVWTYKPRNNDDLKGFSPTLQKAMYPEIPASIYDFSAFGRISIYPNPTQGWVNIVAENAKDAMYCTISDLSGKQLMQTEQAFGNLRADVSGLHSGVYLMQVFMADGTPVATHKLVRQ